MPDPKPQNPSSSPSPTSTLSPSDFSHTLTKSSVALILRFTGFKSSKSSALESLTRVATLFLQSLSSSAASHAASSRRTHCNVFDVLHAIEHHSLSFGFDGASDIHQSLLDSKTIRDLRYFVDAMAVIPVPFFRRVSYRVRNSPSSSVVFSGKKFDFEKNCRGLEIPRWLPEFPELGNIDRVSSKDKEVLWEERKLEYCSPKAGKKIEKGKKEFVVQGRRERVKFRLGGRRRRNAKLGGLEDDLELRNGVCRGGKRVCLNKRIDTSMIFKDDDDKDFTSGL